VGQCSETQLIDYQNLHNNTVCTPRLAAAATVTTTLRLGSYVYDNDFRHPVLLAREAAEIDVLSGGRMELGIGAGWSKQEYDMVCIAFDDGPTPGQPLRRGCRCHPHSARNRIAHAHRPALPPPGLQPPGGARTATDTAAARWRRPEDDQVRGPAG
jgi:hypothetical protein